MSQPAGEGEGDEFGGGSSGDLVGVGGVLGRCDEVERDERVVGGGDGFELEALGVNLLKGVQDPGDLGALGPSREFHDGEAVEVGELGDGVVAGEPVAKKLLVGAGDAEVVWVVWDVRFLGWS